jgi:hypothetical protein
MCTHVKFSVGSHAQLCSHTRCVVVVVQEASQQESQLPEHTHGGQGGRVARR